MHAILKWQKTILNIAIVFSLALGLVYVAPTKASALPSCTAAGQSCKIINANSSKCMDVYQASVDEGAPIKQFTCLGGHLNQQFVIYPSSAHPGYYTIAPTHAYNMCVSVASNVDGGQIQQVQCTRNLASEFWKFVANGSGYSLRPLSSTSRCLDVFGNSLSDNAQLVQEGCNSALSSQRWILF